MPIFEDDESYQQSLANRGFPRAFEKAYNDLRDSALRNTWGALTRLATTSFGKGALLAAAAFLVIPTLGVGLAVATGALTVAYSGVAVGAGTAMLGGLSIGANMLFSLGGAATVLGFGAANAAVAIAKEKKEINTLRDNAQQRIARRGMEAERELEIERSRSHERAAHRAPQVEVEHAPQHAPKVEVERAPEPTAPKAEAQRAPEPQALQEERQGTAPRTPEDRERAAKEPAMQLAHDPAINVEETKFRDRFTQKERPASFVAAEQQRRTAVAASFPPGRSDV